VSFPESNSQGDERKNVAVDERQEEEPTRQLALTPALSRREREFSAAWAMRWIAERR